MYKCIRVVFDLSPLIYLTIIEILVTFGLPFVSNLHQR